MPCFQDVFINALDFLDTICKILQIQFPDSAVFLCDCIVVCLLLVDPSLPVLSYWFICLVFCPWYFMAFKVADHFSFSDHWHKPFSFTGLAIVTFEHLIGFTMVCSVQEGFDLVLGVGVVAVEDGCANDNPVTIAFLCLLVQPADDMGAVTENYFIGQ